MNEKCLLHEEILARVEAQTNEIYVALMGTLEKPGFISTQTAKNVEFEKFKSSITKALSWTITSLLGCVIAAVIGIIFKTL